MYVCSFFNKAVVINGWSASIPNSAGKHMVPYGPEGFYLYSLSFVLYFSKDLQGYAKRWKTVIRFTRLNKMHLQLGHVSRIYFLVIDCFSRMYYLAIDGLF